MLKRHGYEMAVLGLVERPYPDARAVSHACFAAWFAELE